MKPGILSHRLALEPLIERQHAEGYQGLQEVQSDLRNFGICHSKILSVSQKVRRGFQFKVKNSKTKKFCKFNNKVSLSLYRLLASEGVSF